MNPQSSPPVSPPNGEVSQALHIELIRHYAEVLRMLTDRIATPPSLSAPIVASPPPVELSDPVPPEDLPESPSCSDGESADSLLACRDWHTERLVHLWLRPSYVQGLQILFGVGVNLQGHRRIVTVTECGPQDQTRMEAVLDELSTRGLGSGMLVTLPGNIPLQAAVSRVWGSRVWMQRCLNTVMDEALSGLDPEQARRFRHHLQQAWHECDVSKAQKNLTQITTDLTQVNRSSGRVLEHALVSTLTVQRTGFLLRTDRGFRVLNSLKTLLTRATQAFAEPPMHERRLRLCAALLDLEPRLRRVRHSTDLPELSTTLKTSPTP